MQTTWNTHHSWINWFLGNLQCQSPSWIFPHWQYSCWKGTRRAVQCQGMGHLSPKPWMWITTVLLASSMTPREQLKPSGCGFSRQQERGEWVSLCNYECVHVTNTGKLCHLATHCIHSLSAKFHLERPLPGHEDWSCELMWLWLLCTPGTRQEKRALHEQRWDPRHLHGLLPTAQLISLTCHAASSWTSLLLLSLP